MKASLFLIAAAVSGSAHAWQLHEWGTFTTVSGSDGVLLSGLQREEEDLPTFVHSHLGFENGQSPPNTESKRLITDHGIASFVPNFKGLGRRPVSGVTVKMETPVIYFHSDKGFHAKIKIGFEGGTISQWYPNRSGGETPPEPPPSPDPKTRPTPLEHWRIDFAKPYRGGIEWEVDVLTPDESREAILFKPADTLNWLRARVPGANVVRTASGETEGYLFYRGLGNFQPGLHTSVSADETLHLRNLTGSTIPFLLTFERREGKVFWQAANDLAADARLEIPESELVPAADGFPIPVYASMKSGLTAAGLFPAEADAMIQTWWTSYFETDGQRVFWILPAPVTRRVLPLEALPAPEKSVRVIVGRSEVLRQRAEQKWLADSRLKDPQTSPWPMIVAGDRFGLAIQERISGLEKATAAR